MGYCGIRVSPTIIMSANAYLVGDMDFVLYNYYCNEYLHNIFYFKRLVCVCSIQPVPFFNRHDQL